MQPNTTTDHAPQPTPPARRSPSLRRRLALGATVLAVASLLAACGGGSSDDATPTTSAGSSDSSATSAPDAGTDDGSGGTDATTTAVDGAPAIDLCEEVTKDDVAAILPEATLLAAKATPSIPAPNCGYSIDLGAGSGMTADVVTIIWNNPDFFDSQKELQTDETDLTGLDTDAFSIADGGSILVRGETGTWQINRGVELSAGGQPASPEQLVAIAKLVQGL